MTRRPINAEGDGEAAAIAALGRTLASIARSRFDLDEVLQNVVEEAAHLCHADAANIAVRDGDVYRQRAFTGFSPEFETLVRGVAYGPDRESVVGRTILEGRVVHIEDVLADQGLSSGTVMARARRAGGIRTDLGVPIRYDGQLIGVIAAARNEVRPFSERELDLVQHFADQAAVAINLARLLTETHDALEREKAVGHVLRAISRSTFDLDAVLQTVLDSVVRLTRADQGNILREDGGVFRARAFSDDVPPEFRDIISAIAFRPGRGSAMGRALLERQVIQIVDVLADPEYELAEAQRVVGFRTILGAPLLRDGEPIGALSVWRREVRPFTSTELTLLATFADQAVLAIENARLFETIERQRTELARYAPQAAELLSSAEGEQLLAGHRREITALFADMRGFTAFAEKADPEEVLGVLRQYHTAVGELAVANGGTVEHFAGDGLMVFFNDPTPIDDHQLAAVRTACAMRDQFGALSAAWRKRGYELGLGIGIAAGYATVGRIGFQGRYDYGAVGTCVILASRLSSAARAGQILISQRVMAVVEDSIESDTVPDLDLKGFSSSTTAHAVRTVVDRPAG
jgi:class 3 adenylate cyclase